jgi:hypothetical protein
MDKHISLLVAGRGEERDYHDMAIGPGTTVLEAIRETGIDAANHYILEDERGTKFVQGQNLYELAMEGQKFYVLPDEARVA